METEFEVYLDIDGEEEVEELPASAGGFSSSFVQREKSFQPPLQVSQNLITPGGQANSTSNSTAPSSSNRTDSSLVLRTPSQSHPPSSRPKLSTLVLPAPSPQAQVEVLEDSDIEVDVDTPYDGTLFGQTKSKETPASRFLSKLVDLSKTSSLHSRRELPLSSYTVPSFGVAKKSTTARKSTTRQVAVKSSTPKKQGNASTSNVARKSTTKQSQPISNRPSTSSSGLLKVKFLPAKPTHSAPNTRPTTSNAQKNHFDYISSSKVLSSGDAPPTLKTSVPKYAAKQPEFRSSSLPTKGPGAVPECFPFSSSSSEYMECPVCLVNMKQLSLKRHLKRKHNVTLRVCGKCKLAFVNVHLYSEHYALHLQQEENRQVSAPFHQNTNSIEYVTPEPLPPPVKPEGPPPLWQRSRSFRFLERSGDKMSCPECGIMVRQHSIRHHLKDVHDLNLRTCKKCQLGYTDMNMYNEHCADHYQQEEEKMKVSQRSATSHSSWLQTSLQRSLVSNSDNLNHPTGSPFSEMQTGDHLKSITGLQNSLIQDKRKSEQLTGPQTSVSTSIANPQPLTSPATQTTKVVNKIKEEELDDTPTVRCNSVTSFDFIEKSTIKVPCPECSLLISQNNLRDHLQALHGLLLKSCRKCRLAFTLISEFNEHCATHNEQKQPPAPVSKRTMNDIPPLVLPPLPPKPKKPMVAIKHTSPFKHPSTSPPKIPSSSPPKRPSTSFPDSRPSFIEVPFPVQPKLPPKPRKPSVLRRRHPAPAFSGDSFSPVNDAASSDGEPEKEDWQEEQSSTPKLPIPRSNHYRSTQKAAVRKRLLSPATPTVPSSFTSAPTPPKKIRTQPNFSALPKKIKSQNTVATGVTSQKMTRVTVDVVSLELAANPFDCKTCFAAFNIAMACPRSFRKHSQQILFSCNNCPAVFKRKDQLKIHRSLQCTSMSKVHFVQGSTQNDDSKEPKQSSSGEDLHNIAKASVAQSDADGRLECIVCQKQFNYRSALIMHVKYHTHQYCCSFCKKAFENKIELLDHFQIMHCGKSRLLCRYCRRQYDNVTEFERHVSIHKDGTVVACTVCAVKFGDASAMFAHLSSEHGQNEPRSGYRCKTCGRVYKKSQPLALHMKVAHGRGKPIVTKFLSCRICRTVFHNKQGLASHYSRVHGMSLPASLSSTTSKTFVASHNKYSRNNPSTPKAQVDEDSVSDSNLECPICRRNYSTRKGLLVHLKNIHSSKGQHTVSTVSHKCNFCKKQLNSYHSLQTHISNAHPNFITKAFKCRKCPSSFTRLSNLNNHYRQRHGITKTDKTASRHGITKTDKTASRHGITKTDKTASVPCPFCNKGFKANKYMRMHVRLFHPSSFQDLRLRSKSNKANTCVPKSRGSKTNVRPSESASSKSSNISSSNRNESTEPKASVAQRVMKYSCPLCERAFEYKGSWFRHLQVNHGLTKTDIEYNLGRSALQAPSTKSSKSRTNISSTSSASLSALSSPSQTSTTPSSTEKRQLYICKICKDCFSLKCSFLRHQKNLHDGKKVFFQCRKKSCRKTFTRVANLKNHIDKAHPEMSLYRCISCRTWFDTSEEVLAHACTSVGDSKSVENSESESAISIPASNPSSSSTSQASVLEQEFRYRCMTCGAGFHIAREWTTHVQEHSTETTGNTSNYDKVMDATDTIRLNIFDILSADRVFRCEECDKIFTEETALKLHVCAKLSTAAAKASPRTKSGEANGAVFSNEGEAGIVDAVAAFQEEDRETTTVEENQICSAEMEESSEFKEGNQNINEVTSGPTENEDQQTSTMKSKDSQVQNDSKDESVLGNFSSEGKTVSVNVGKESTAMGNKQATNIIENATKELEDKLAPEVSFAEGVQSSALAEKGSIQEIVAYEKIEETAKVLPPNAIKDHTEGESSFTVKGETKKQADQTTKASQKDGNNAVEQTDPNETSTRSQKDEDNLTVTVASTSKEQMGQNNTNTSWEIKDSDGLEGGIDEADSRSTYVDSLSLTQAQEDDLLKDDSKDGGSRCSAVDSKPALGNAESESTEDDECLVLDPEAPGDEPNGIQAQDVAFN